MIQLNYRDSKPIYEQIKDGFRKLVISGSLLAQEEILDTRQEELLGQFDEVVEELFFLSVKEADLEERMKKLAKGGENQ